MLILGGIMLNIVVCGMLFRPLELSPSATTYRQKREILLIMDCDKEDPLNANKEEGQSLLKSEKSESTPRLDQCQTISIVLTEGDGPNETIQNGINDEHFKVQSSSCPNMYPTTHQSSSKAKNMATSVKAWLLRLASNLVDADVLQSPSFMYLCLSILLLYLTYDVPYMFTPDKAMQMGISEKEASFLVSIIGITSTFGQVIIGYIGDLQKVNTVVLYSILTTIAGIFTILVPWFTTYAWLCTFSASYGFFISANYTLVSVIIVDLLGIEKFTYAYGIEALSEGLANIIGPPFAGRYIINIMLST